MELDRKTIEKNRRNYMKFLCFKLASLIPSHHLNPSKDMISQLEKAASYIKIQRERIEELKMRKEMAVESLGLELPIIELKEIASCLEVILICGMKNRFLLYQIITLLHEEGVEVTNASFSTVGVNFFYTIHAKVKISRIGVDTSSMYKRLKELVN